MNSLTLTNKFDLTVKCLTKNEKTSKQCKMLLLASRSMNTKQQQQFNNIGANNSLLNNSGSQQNKANMLSFNQ